MNDEIAIRRAIDLAREALDAGDEPFGSLLVLDGDVIRTARNTVHTDDDVTAHPELKLARWAARELDDGERTACTMYTSTEPCAMCATAIHYAALGRVAYSVAAASVVERWGPGGASIPCGEVIERAGGDTVVDGPILEDEGLAVLERYFGE